LTKRRGQSTIIEDYRRQRVNLKNPQNKYSHSYKVFPWANNV